MNISGIGNKFLNPIEASADKIGLAAGALTDNGLQTIISSIQQAVAGVIHFPTVEALQDMLGYSAVSQGILAYIAGYAIEAIAPGNLKKIGSALQKGAVGFETAYLAQKLFYISTHSQIKGNNVENDSIHENFQNAPLAQRYY